MYAKQVYKDKKASSTSNTYKVKDWRLRLDADEDDFQAKSFATYHNPAPSIATEESYKKFLGEADEDEFGVSLGDLQLDDNNPYALGSDNDDDSVGEDEGNI